MIFLVIMAWLVMWYFSVRGFLLISGGPLDAGDLGMFVFAFITAPMAFLITVTDGNNDLKELFFLGKSKPKSGPRAYEKPVKKFFRISGRNTK